jgi:hypothetical protein
MELLILSSMDSISEESPFLNAQQQPRDDNDHQPLHHRPNHCQICNRTCSPVFLIMLVLNITLLLLASVGAIIILSNGSGDSGTIQCGASHLSENLFWLNRDIRRVSSFCELADLATIS